MEAFWHDFRYGFRLLLKSPGFVVIAILTLALGIGANTAIFSYVNAWIIKPLPYPQPERLMSFESHDKKRGWTREGLTSTASFLDFQKQNTSFEQTALWTGWNFNLTGDAAPQLVEGGRVSWNFFDTLGVRPLLGRTFRPEEDRPGAGHVVILSQGLWQGRFGGESRILRRNITIDGESYTVIGVMASTFQFPLIGLSNLWTPLALTDADSADRSKSTLSAFGRLKPGVTPKQAGAESAAIYNQLEIQFPETNKNLNLLVSSMTDEVSRKEGAPEVMTCLCIVGLLLLIACANVANLVMARATSRATEFAIRGALGATRGRLIRQLLTEFLLLFSLGGAAGTLVGLGGMHWIDSEIPGRIRGYLVNYGHVELDGTTLGFTLGIVLLCAFAFGLLPACDNSRHYLHRTMQEMSGKLSESRRGARLRSIFVTSEIALAVLVLISTMLLVKSFVISVRSGTGYDTTNVMVAQLSLPGTKYTQDSHRRNFSEDVLARIRALPRVVSVAAASSVPFGSFGQSVEIQASNQPEPMAGEHLRARFTSVSVDYFSTMRIALVEGRMFNSGDTWGGSPSVVINETLAREFWPNQSAVGQALRFGQPQTMCVVVGVVKDIKMYQLRARPERQMYVSLAQFPSATLGLVARTVADSTDMTSGIRNAIWAVDKDQPVFSIETLETLMATANAGNRILTKLMVFFAAMAMFLGVIGIYGVMTELVLQRTREVGIRMALGASRIKVMDMVISRGVKLILIGVGIGILWALGMARLFAAMLYQVPPNDPLTFIAVPFIFTATAVIACYIPARRTMAVDPLVALRDL